MMLIRLFLAAYGQKMDMRTRAWAWASRPSHTPQGGLFGHTVIRNHFLLVSVMNTILFDHFVQILVFPNSAELSHTAVARSGAKRN